jgi:hypothetical protein
MEQKEAVLLIFLLILTAGCASFSPEEIKERIIESNSDVDSYDLEMDMEMSMHTQGWKHAFSASTDLNYTGTIDKENRRLFLRMKGFIDIGLESDIEMEMYYADDYFYTGTLGYWTRQKAPVELWGQQEQMQNILKILRDSEIEILDQDSSTIRIKISPDRSRLLQYALKENDNSFAQDKRAIDYDELVQENEITIWVDRKSFLIKRQKLYLNLMMTSENMGISGPEEQSDTRIDLSLKIDTRLKNIDQAEPIVLPEEAKDAIDTGEFDSGTITLADLNMISTQTISEILG